ncbi:adenylylsulfate kinase [Comamonas sp. JUb58]|nr:adenylylsulfate kinase [Comamonas sp. JUb58]
MTGRPKPAASIFPHGQALQAAQRAALMGHAPCCIWFTGLSASGKTSLAHALERALHQRGCHTCALDGDNLRQGLNADLGFSAEARAENIRRMAHVARLMADAGLVVIVAAISPFAADRVQARALFAPGAFVEVFVDTPLAVCEARDPKGLYARARRGELRDFTGIDSPYERPLQPELHLRGEDLAPEAALRAVLAYLDALGLEQKRPG